MLVDLHCEVICSSIYIAKLYARRFYIADLIDCTSYVNEPKIKLLKSKLESCTVSSCSRSGTLE